MKKIIILFLALMLSGCSYANSNSSTSLNTDKSNSSKIGFKQSESHSSSAGIKQSVTPYQYLNLFAENSNNFSLSYNVELHEANKTESGKIYKLNNMFAESFTTFDANNKTVQVREVLKENSDYFIIEGSKKIAIYKAPANEMLLNKMLFASKGKPKNVYNKDEFTIYEYDIPFEQDNSLYFTYRFYMNNQQIQRLELLFDNKLKKTYEFTSIEQDTADVSVFEIPKDYNSVIFDYQFTNEHAPPWWDNK